MKQTHYVKAEVRHGILGHKETAVFKVEVASTNNRKEWLQGVRRALGRRGYRLLKVIDYTTLMPV